MRLRWNLVVLGLVLALPVQVPAESAGGEPVPLEELRLFAEILSRVKQNFVDDVDDRELLEDAIRGMLDGLDPHSAYLDEEDFEALREDTRGEFGGLGIEVGSEDGLVKVIAPMDDTPAHQAGIKAGDLIVRIDNQPVKDMLLSDAVEMMRGKPGTSITLTILRKGVDKPFDVVIKRAVIRVKSVKYRLLDDGYGYVRIASFQDRTADDLLKAIRRLRSKSDGELKGLVVDLRNNPGGVLDAAVAVSDAFLESGLIVYTEGRTDDSRSRFDAQPDDVLEGAPMVVLVDEGSASASEIVAGALQDHRRAVIMGRRTFGKGSVQTIVPVGRKAAVKITTARYFTPSGRSIQAEGIEPDIVLAPVTVQLQEEDGLSVTEAQLAGHLQNGDAKPLEDDGDTAQLVREDYALSEALNLLKGMAILSKGN